MNYVKNLFLLLVIFTFGVKAEETKIAELIGNYSCTFTQEGYTYDPFSCVIKKVDQNLVLEKISGSQRIKGDIHLTTEGFDFEGTYFCPFGDCTSPAKGKFKKLSEGKYEGPVYTEDSTPYTLVNLIKKK